MAAFDNFGFDYVQFIDEGFAHQSKYGKAAGDKYTPEAYLSDLKQVQGRIEEPGIWGSQHMGAEHLHEFGPKSDPIENPATIRPNSAKYGVQKKLRKMQKKH